MDSKEQRGMLLKRYLTLLFWVYLSNAQNNSCIEQQRLVLDKFFFFKSLKFKNKFKKTIFSAIF